MKKAFFDEHFKKGRLISCVAVSLSRIGFILKDYPDEDDRRELDELPTRLIAYLPDVNPYGEYGVREWSDALTTLFVECAMQNEEHNWIVCNDNFLVQEINERTTWYDIPNNEQGRMAKALKNIAGTVYAAGIFRSVFKRTGTEQWDNLTKKADHPNLFADLDQLAARKRTPSAGDVGFNTIDGFAEDDLYAGGNAGDCWHYNGKHWRKVDLPLNSDISTITCAPDGKVYVACDIGPVVVGRDNQWKAITPGGEQIYHSAWFDGRIYFSSRLGRIYTIEADELIEASFKSDMPSHMHHLIKGIAACEECLVAYTNEQAYAYDGQVWHEIVEIPSLSKHK